MREIKLTQGKVALVDDEDYERLNRYRWCAFRNLNTYYASRSISGSATISMHRQILSVSPGKEIDHKDGNGLNNQKDNLRSCTHSQNCANQRSQVNVSSKFKGVFWETGRRKWNASIGVAGQRMHLGRFKTEKAAALVYNVAAINHFGEFARLNIVNQVSREDISEKLKELGL